MLPMLQKEIVDKHKWATEEELLDYFAIGQSTPGIIAVNTATFVGYKKKGIPGSIAATLGIICPSLIIISLLALIFSEFAGEEYFEKAFSGIRIAVVALIIQAVVRIGKKAVINKTGIVLSLLAFVCGAFLNISPLPVIAVAIITGIIVSRIRRGGK